MRRRFGWWIGGSLLLSAAAAWTVARPDLAAQAAAGMAAHNLCSASFVAGLDPDATFREFVRPLVGGPIGRFLRYRVNRKDKTVQTSFAWTAHARAQFTPGYGCRLDYVDNVPAPAPVPPAVAQPDDFAPAGPVATSDPAIGHALDQVFSERPGRPAKRVKAIVVVKDGHVVAERYAPGFGIDTPLLSYSVAKSFTNALFGILVHQKRLRIDQKVAAHEWAGAADPRASISLEDLLRMRSGLDAAETGSGFDPATRMLYSHADMAAFAAQHTLKHDHGATWEYTSANTLILDRVLGDTVGGRAAGMRGFAMRELFAPLGMGDVTMEFDGAGVFIGSSYVYASARSFARFGELYRNDGIAPNGHRLLPEGWVAWSSRSTLGFPYGAGFWTNDGPSKQATGRVALGFPKDGFFASGNMGQRIYIIPSELLVIARFGYSEPPMFGIDDDLSLIDTVIRATRRAR
jgi:CubicO group peptidase (beta-lactamase class C family)